MKAIIILVIYLSNYLITLQYSIAEAKEITNVCPDSKKLKGCICNENELSIVCEQTKEVPDFEKSLKGFHFNSITLKNTSITKLPKSNAVTDKLILINNQHLGDFDKLLSFKAKSLHLINNRLFNLEKFNKIFEGVQESNLVELNVENHTCDSIHTNCELKAAFHNFSNLTKISLKNNEIQSVDSLFCDYCYEKLNHLLSVDLSYNNINTIGTNTFVLAKVNKINLDLSHNKIEDLSRSGIERNPHGSKIDLSNNLITDVTFKPFSDICSNQITVLLGDNPLKCKYDQAHWVVSRHNCIEYIHGALCSTYGKNLFEMKDQDFKDRISSSTISFT